MIGWDSDNSEWLVREIIPKMVLSDADKAVMKWAYLGGWELKSDGETGVEDDFMGGMVKSPAGVVHDYVNRVKNHTTPDGHKWTPWEANALFRRIKKAQWALETGRKKKHGDINRLTGLVRWFRGFRERWRRWLAVSISVPIWWR
jgi:hypothetical protein